MDNVASDHPRFRYLIFGWTVLSELECPELEMSSGVPELFFRFGAVPGNLPFGKIESLAGEAAPGLFLLKIRDTVSFLIRDGREVVMDLAPGSCSDAVRLFLLGPVLGILLHQRSFLPIHGSAILSEGAAVIFAGPTGSGKSTLAAAFFRRGYSVIADEICALDTSRKPEVVPAPPYLSLWADALTGLEIGFSDLRPVRSDLRKFLMPAGGVRGGSRVPLGSCYIIECSNHPGEITLQRMEGMPKIEALAMQTYRRSFIDALDLTSSNFEQICKISVSTRVVLVRRPRGEFTADRLADAIEKDLVA